ncbi:MAG: hypothetical protein V4574_18490 [Pseudomonadota bacterium]
MSDPSIIQANERLKGLANLLFNLGAALLGAVAVRLYGLMTIDVSIALWSILSATLIWMAYMVLGLLQSETIA